MPATSLTALAQPGWRTLTLTHAELQWWWWRNRTDWQQEFKRWAPDLNVVMYVGNRESRDIIRRTEFYTAPMGHQRPQLKFNVLLTTYEMVLKDEEELGYGGARPAPWNLGPR